MLQAANTPPLHTPGHPTSHLPMDLPSCPMAKDPFGHTLIADSPDFHMAESSLNPLDSPTPNFNPLAEDMELSDNPDFYGSPTNQPLSSAEPSSAAVSDSEFLQPTLLKATKQTGLLNFFSKIPPEEAHERWQKRKWENEGRDRVEYAKRKQKDEAGKLRKQAQKREQNRVSQGRRRERLKKEKGKMGLQDSSVSLPCALLNHLYTYHFLGGIHT
jgi:hypothetical protein